MHKCLGILLHFLPIFTTALYIPTHRNHEHFLKLPLHHFNLTSDLLDLTPFFLSNYLPWFSFGTEKYCTSQLSLFPFPWIQHILFCMSLFCVLNMGTITFSLSDSLDYSFKYTKHNMLNYNMTYYSFLGRRGLPSLPPPFFTPSFFGRSGLSGTLIIGIPAS